MKSKTASVLTWDGRHWLILLAAFVSIALTASLGVWQLRRAAHKIALHEQILKQSQLPPVNHSALIAITSVANGDPSWLHRKVVARGRWLHEHTVFLDNRPMQVGAQQRVGFYVATPLLLEGADLVVWVQRGWVARDFQDRSRLPQLAQPPGVVEVQGRIIAQISRAYELGSAYAPKVEIGAAGSSRIWQNLPAIDFKPRALLPVAILQTHSSAPEEGLLRNWPAADTGVAKHHGYAFQWFALSALILVLYVWFQFIVPRRKRAQEQQG